MKRSIIILYWLAICVPTLVVGSFAWSMLQHEQERLQMARRISAEGRAEILAQHLQVAVYDIQTSLRSALERAVDAAPYDDAAQRLAKLRQLGDRNPLVRNVFVWSPTDGVQFPNPTRPATQEERRFLLRYAALFNGGMPWEAPMANRFDPATTTSGASAGAPGGASYEANAGGSASILDGLAANSEEVQQEQQQSAVQEYEEPTQTVTSDYGQISYSPPNSGLGLERGQQIRRGGWMPWYADNRLGLLGWYQREQDGVIVGVELEMMSFLSLLLPTLPEGARDNAALALLDGDGRPLYQTANMADLLAPPPTAEPTPGQGKGKGHGQASAQVAAPMDGNAGLRLAPGVTELARRPVGAVLPHWQVVVYEGPNSYPGGGFEAVSRLLLAIFVAAVLIGGSLLLWQARRYQTEARQKTDFVSNVSHELKTPLTSIRMYAELLSEGRARDPQKAQRYLEIIVTESQRLTRLVGNVLDFSRLEQGSQRFQPVDLDQADVVNLTLDGIAMRLAEAGMALTVELPVDGPAIVHADRDALEQILLNLLENALKYGSAGGELHLSLSRDGQGRVLLSLADRGPGVPAGQRERIFDAFHRVDDALTATTGGTGLGLSIARRLARGMGGDLTYRPNTADGRNAGARFDLHLPAALATSS